MPRPDVIVASMPPHDIAYEAARYGKANNIPVIVDIRDPWPDLFLNHVPILFRGIFRILLSKDFMMTRNTKATSYSLIAVTDTFLSWGLAYAKRKKRERDRVFYLGYKKRSAECNSSSRLQTVVKGLENKFCVIFVGTFGYYHNPSILIDCADRLNRLHEHGIHFIIAGDGEYLHQIKKRSAGLPNVTFTGWLDQAEIDFLLENTHVGLCPTPQNIDFFPNKAFAYFAWNLPVISALQGDLRKILEEHGAGFYYPPNDVETLMECIRKLRDAPDLYKKMSDNARRIFDALFDADRIYRDYADHVERIALNFQISPVRSEGEKGPVQ